MAATDPSKVEAIELVSNSWTGDDESVAATLTTEAIDDDTTTEINALDVSKIGKGGGVHGEALRIEFSSGFGDLAANDTITVWLGGLHAVNDLAMLAYTDVNTVTTTDKIVETSVSGQTIFTLTSAFITALNDLGSGSFAVRIVEDLGVSGDWKIAEVDADLTVGGAPALFLPIFPKRQNTLLRM